MFTLEKEEGIGIPYALKLPIEVAGQISEDHEDIACLEAIEAYFKRLYHFRGEQGLDTKDILKQLEGRSIPFATVARQFKLIENETIAVLIDGEPEAQAITEKIRRGEYSRQLVRDAGQYCVNLYQNDFERLHGAGLLEAMDLGFFRLRDSKLYSEEKGLKIRAERGDALFGFD